MIIARYQMTSIAGPGGRSRSGTDASHKTRFFEERESGHRQPQDAQYDSNGRRGRKSVRPKEKHSRRVDDRNAGMVLPVRMKNKSRAPEQTMFERDTRSVANNWNDSGSLQNQLPPMYDVPSSSKQQGRSIQQQALRSGPQPAGPPSFGPNTTGPSGYPPDDLPERQAYNYDPNDNSGDNYDDRYDVREGSGRQDHQHWQGSQRSPSPRIMLISREPPSLDGIWDQNGDYHSDVEERNDQPYPGLKAGSSSRQGAYGGPASSYGRW